LGLPLECAVRKAHPAINALAHGDLALDLRDLRRDRIVHFFFAFRFTGFLPDVFGNAASIASRGGRFALSSRMARSASSRSPIFWLIASPRFSSSASPIATADHASRAWARAAAATFRGCRICAAL